MFVCDLNHVFTTDSPHLRDPSAPPSGLTGKPLKNWVRNAEHALNNHRYQQDYPPFHIPSKYYRVFHLNRFTDSDTIQLIPDHIHDCVSFSVDTENDDHSHEIALIQIHSIPVALPSVILLVELNHLPPRDTSRFRKFCEIFYSLFRSGNTIYGWGPPVGQLEKALPRRLFSFPLVCECINLQKEFALWFAVKASSCVCDECLSFQYIHSRGPWSLQNAIRYVAEAFLDKSSTKSHWSYLLEPLHSPLSSQSCHTMVTYALYDCLAVTYLHHPTMKLWNLSPHLSLS